MPHRKNPVIAQRAPYVVELKAGEQYFWCTCGRSENQPFCDGSHQNTEFKPLAFSVEKDDLYPLCGCKYTKHPPFCDRSHRDLD
ncbi:MAG: CDGSH iron-sulfur domain-containing protein [Thiotrichales bacterium]